LWLYRKSKYNECGSGFQPRYQMPRMRVTSVKNQYTGSLGFVYNQVPILTDTSSTQSTASTPETMNDQLSNSDKDRSKSGRLPERVVSSIVVRQNAGERMVGWFQLSFLILFGFLYAVAPKAVSAEKTYEILPWFLLVYFLLTVIRLIVAYRSRIPEPLLYVSVIVDIGLLLGMIWTLHIQYQQPPSFYLKAPTLLYVFIFIALRALRFEARYVIMAGIVASVGWLTLAAYAISGLLTSRNFNCNLLRGKYQFHSGAGVDV